MGAGAKILGAFEVGDHCTIAANAVLLKPLEDNITAAGVPARAVKKDGVPVAKAEQAWADAKAFRAAQQQIEEMREDVERLKERL